MKKKEGLKIKFNNFSTWVTKVTGSPRAFFIAILVVVGWGLTGPMFNFSETWQLVINTGTTIVTFLMMFVIQQSQNKDTMALHLKLNELLASNELTSNRLVASEDLTEEELEVIKKYYKKLSTITQGKGSLFSTHSIDEATQDAQKKIDAQPNNKTTIINQKNKKK